MIECCVSRLRFLFVCGFGVLFLVKLKIEMQYTYICTHIVRLLCLHKYLSGTMLYLLHLFLHMYIVE